MAAPLDGKSVGWLLDADMFDAYRDELVAAIREQGHEAKFIRAPAPPFRWEDIGCSYRETFPEDACVIMHGDIQMATKIYQESRWFPGAFCTVENFACSSYYCWYGEDILNRDYIMLPFGELDRCQDFLFHSLGIEDKVFIRPDSPLKLFGGQIASRNTFATDLEFMGFYEFPKNALVVVSSPKPILVEWRFVVAEKQVIAGCRYKTGAQFQPDPEYDPAAFELASKIASRDYQPDPVWILDICQAGDGAYHLLEIGGFSFADLYACDKAAVVRAASAAALAVWKHKTLHG